MVHHALQAEPPALARAWKPLRPQPAVAKRFYLAVMLLAALGCQRERDQPAPVDALHSRTPGEARSQSQSSVLRFEDRAIAAFAECSFSNGHEAGLKSILEIVGGGVGCVDYDHDGTVDLFFPRGGYFDVPQQQVLGINSALLRGTGDWGFDNRTSAARVDTQEIYSHGISAVDFNQDGLDDLLVYGFGGVKLFCNLGDGTFADATQAANLGTAAWTTTAAWLDVNGDQTLDLYLGSYVDWSFEKNEICKATTGQEDVCSPNVFQGTNSHVYLNNADGTFTHAPQLMQVPQLAKSLGSVAAQFDSDRGVGLYVANDLLANFLFSRQDGQWKELGLTAGVAVDDRGVANGSMGVAVLDFNQDQQLDLFVTNFEHELMGLYLGEEGEFFQHRSRQVGLNRSELRIVGFGVVAADFDHDSDEDVVIAAGHVHYFPDHGAMGQQPVALRNEAGQSFSIASPDCRFFTQAVVGRGLASADIDNDGDLDLVSTNLLGAPMASENTLPTNDAWLTLSLIGVDCARTPVGATVELPLKDKTLVRQLVSGGSYLSQVQQRLHFAWSPGQQTSARVTMNIRWPGQAQVQVVQALPGQHLVIVQNRDLL